MIDIGELAIVVLLPAATAAGVAWWLRRFRPSFAAELAICWGWVAGNLGLVWHTESAAQVRLGTDWLPALGRGLRELSNSVTTPSEARGWLPLAVALGTLLSCLPASTLGKQRALELAWLGLCVALPWRLLYGSVYLTRDWTHFEASLWLAGLGLVLWLSMWLLPKFARQVPRWTGVCVMTLLFVSLAMTLLMSGSKVYGILGIGLAAGVFPAAAVLMSHTSPDDHPQTLRTLLLLFSGLIMLGYFFAELTAVNALLLYVSFLLSAVTWPDATKTSTYRWGYLRLWVASGLAILALGCAAITLVRTMAEEADNPYTISAARMNLASSGIGSITCGWNEAIGQAARRDRRQRAHGLPGIVDQQGRRGHQCHGYEDHRGHEQVAGSGRGAKGG